MPERIDVRPRLDEQLAIERDRIGPWRASIAPTSTGFGGAHGGLLAALALRALQTRLRESELPPRSLMLRFLEPTRPEGVELAVEVERSGRSSAAASVRLRQGGIVTCVGHGLFGADRDSPGHLGVEMPAVPPPEDCSPSAEEPPPEVRGLSVEYRPAAPPLPLHGGDRAELLVWMRLAEERPLDLAAATMLADAGPPALFGVLTRFVPIPSAEISLQYCEHGSLGDSPWLLGAFRTLFARDGYAIEDGEMWTPSGRLVLLSRQVRRILAGR